MDTICKALASALCAHANCIKANNMDWKQKHEDHINEIMSDSAPSGSGIDNGTKFDMEFSTPEKLVFHLGYHHMNDGGFYDGWTTHTATVTPSLVHGINLKISGPNRNDIKDYLHDVLHSWLTSPIPVRV